MAAPSIVQAKSVSGTAGNYPWGFDQKTTLDSGTTNGNTLVAFFFRGSATGDTEDPAGAPFYSDTDVADWTFPVNVLFTSSTTGSFVMCGYRTIKSTENSAQFNWANGAGGPENCCSALFEIDARVIVAAYTTSDLSGTGTTVPLAAVSALNEDLLIAGSQFHDNEGSDPTWSDGFTHLTETIATSGEPDESLRTAQRDADSAADFGTTQSWGTPPPGDERDGVIVAIRAHILPPAYGTITVTGLPAAYGSRVSGTLPPSYPPVP